MTNYAESVERWTTCKWAVAFGYSDREVVDAMAIQDERENYGCGNSNVIEKGIDVDHFDFTTVKNQDEWIVEVAILHRFGMLLDPRTIKSIDKACGKCPYFRRRSVKPEGRSF